MKTWREHPTDRLYTGKGLDDQRPDPPFVRVHPRDAAMVGLKYVIALAVVSAAYFAWVMW